MFSPDDIEGEIQRASKLSSRQPNSDGGGDLDYVSRFNSWDRHASVRAKERRLVTQITSEESAGGVVFPASMVPVLSHPTVKALGAEAARELQVRSLYTYLDFTAELEQCVVNPIACQISRGKLGVPLPSSMKEDAYKIYVDEAWHSCFSDDLQRQIEHATGLYPIEALCPLFMERLARLEHDLSMADRQLARVFFAIVSETLISSFLADIPADHSVIEPVRALIADHAIDEGRHHSYFSQLLRSLWPQLGRQQQAIIGCMVPDFIQAFLDPDLRGVAAMLMQSPLTETETEEILMATYAQGSSHEFSARHTVRHLEEVGMLQDTQVLERFQEAGLV